MLFTVIPSVATSFASERANPVTADRRLFDNIKLSTGCFTLIDVTPQRVQADYYLTPVPTDERPDPRVDATVVPVYRSSWQTVAGTRRVSAAAAPIGPRSDRPTGHH